jgi:hypothetical protein
MKSPIYTRILTAPEFLREIFILVLSCGCLMNANGNSDWIVSGLKNIVMMLSILSMIVQKVKYPYYFVAQ